MGIVMGRGNGYKTRQKSAILNYFKNNGDKHATAYDISSYLSGSGTPVGMATIYRYIDSLMTEGLLQKHVLDEGKGAVYQYLRDSSCAEHFHLKCELCGDLIHMECGQMREIYAHVSQDHDFHINSRKTVFYGQCGSCRREKEADL